MSSDHDLYFEVPGNPDFTGYIPVAGAIVAPATGSVNVAKTPFQPIVLLTVTERLLSTP